MPFGSNKTQTYKAIITTTSLSAVINIGAL